MSTTAASTLSNNSPVFKLRMSSSHPDLSSLQFLQISDVKSNQPAYCLRVFRADHVCKYFPIHKVRLKHGATFAAYRGLKIRADEIGRFTSVNLFVVKKTLIQYAGKEI